MFIYPGVHSAPPVSESKLKIILTTLKYVGNTKILNNYLPNLKIMELWYLDNLIMTPNFDGLPKLERFILKGSPHLKEIHSSFGGLDRLVCLCIVKCEGIKKFPSITRLQRIETLSFAGCPRLIESLKIQQKMDSLGDEDVSSGAWESSNLNHIGLCILGRCLRDLCLGLCGFGDEDTGSAVRDLPNLKHIRLCFCRQYLRKLDLSGCNLGDEDMISAVWELPNLQELDLSHNKFSRLEFILIRTPSLKFLNVSDCKRLVELSELPSSIAVLKANNCSSLETFGDISNCKWLWKVSFRGANKVGDGDPPDGTLLDSMLKGNAFNDYRISVTLQHHIPKRIVEIHILIKQEVDEVSRFELGHGRESSEELESEYDGTKTYVGYVSFNSLRGTAFLNSTYNVILISLRQHGFPIGATDRIGAALVPKNDPVQTTKLETDCSEFWDEDHFRPTFTIKQNTKSCINILWRPNH
ncbi:unnamed protein product [Lactuca saligna]|uniref:Uncharacterized protein n=1 Tax=Lactuca saligna TaxID=75948 RepID=A0AA36EJC6_LACSI|nr:unnamed protein product [Lactuca saligna]